MKDFSIIGPISHVGVHLVGHLTETGLSVNAKYRSDLAPVASQFSNPLDLVVHRPNNASDVQPNVLSIDRIISESEWGPRIDRQSSVALALRNGMNSNSPLGPVY